MKRPYTRKLETPIGIFYLAYNISDDTPHCDLLDSNKKWITYIYHKETINKLKNIQSAGDIVEICKLQNCTWAQTIEELAEEINDTYHWDEEYADERWTAEDLANYNFLNKVGTTYFIVDYE